MNTMLEVSTAGGVLEVIIYEDPDYPGFTLNLNGSQVGVFEWDSSEQSVRLHGWAESSGEDPAFSLDVRESEWDKARRLHGPTCGPGCPEKCEFGPALIEVPK
jgi:hypothetical protein